MFCILYLIVCLVTTGASSDGTVVGQLSKTNAQSGLEWFDVTSSANGATSVVVRRTDTYSSDLYISNDYAPQDVAYYTVECSADCSHIYASALPIGFYYSYDYGKTWTNASAVSLPPEQLYLITTSGTGELVHVAGPNIGPYSSSDYGETFTISQSFSQQGRDWGSIACSFDGGIVVVTAMSSINGKWNGD